MMNIISSRLLVPVIVWTLLLIIIIDDLVH